MSSAAVQNALAILIRLPDSNRGETFEPFSRTFDLTPHETGQLRALSQDSQVAKYGRAMSSVRFVQLRKHMRLLIQYLGYERFEDLRINHFEARSTKVRVNGLALGFFEFVFSDAVARELIDRNCPPFIWDTLRVDEAQTKLRFNQVPPIERGGESLLTGNPFLLLELEYDIPTFLQEIFGVSEFPKDLAPTKRRVEVLLMPSEEFPMIRMFEIGVAEHKFLTAQLAGKPFRLPSDYQELVKLGLCQSGTVH